MKDQLERIIQVLRSSGVDFNVVSIVNIPKVDRLCTVKLLCPRYGVKIFDLCINGEVVYRMESNNQIVENYTLSPLDSFWVKELVSLLGDIYLLEWRKSMNFLQAFYTTSQVFNCTVHGDQISLIERIR